MLLACKIQRGKMHHHKEKHADLYQHPFQKLQLEQHAHSQGFPVLINVLRRIKVFWENSKINKIN